MEFYSSGRITLYLFTLGVAHKITRKNKKKLFQKQRKTKVKKWGKFLPSTFRNQRNVTYTWKFTTARNLVLGFLAEI